MSTIREMSSQSPFRLHIQARSLVLARAGWRTPHQFLHNHMSAQQRSLSNTGYVLSLRGQVWYFPIPVGFLRLWPRMLSRAMIGDSPLGNILKSHDPGWREDQIVVPGSGVVTRFSTSTSIQLYPFTQWRTRVGFRTAEPRTSTVKRQAVCLVSLFTSSRIRRVSEQA